MDKQVWRFRESLDRTLEASTTRFEFATERAKDPKLLMENPMIRDWLMSEAANITVIKRVLAFAESQTSIDEVTREVMYNMSLVGVSVTPERPEQVYTVAAWCRVVDKLLAVLKSGSDR